MTSSYAATLNKKPSPRRGVALVRWVFPGRRTQECL